MRKAQSGRFCAASRRRFSTHAHSSAPWADEENRAEVPARMSAPRGLGVSGATGRRLFRTRKDRNRTACLCGFQNEDVPTGGSGH
eukprot:scaffold7927_cov296-Pinguiococcus_pyrenoidosus.AAC.3